MAAILDGWDGHFTILMRKRIARHIESCPTCDEDRQRLVSPAALLGAVPVFIPAPAWLRDRTLSDIRLVCLDTPITGGTADAGAESVAVSQTPPIPDGHVDDAHDRRPRNVMLVALFLATLLISLGLAIAWVYQQNTSITPADVTETSPVTVSTTPAAPTTSNPSPAPPTAVDTPPVQSPGVPAPLPDLGPPAAPAPPPDSGPPPSQVPRVSPQPTHSLVPTVSLAPRTPISKAPTTKAVVPGSRTTVTHRPSPPPPDRRSGR